jgi:hypothetical protein
MKFEIAKSTACLMLKDQSGKLVDYQFVNKYYFLNTMTWDDFYKEMKSFLKRNNIIEDMAISWV